MNSPGKSTSGISEPITPRDGETSSRSGIEKKAVQRVNTYLPAELFKLVLIAPNKERAEEEAGWLTGTNTQVRGLFMCNHLKTKMAIFCRWPGMQEKQTSTVAVEALVVYVKDLTEWENVKEETMKYSQIPVRVIVSENDEVDKAAKELKAVRMPRPKENKTLRVELDKFDREEYKKIQAKFNQFDEDNSGSIESSEMSKVAESLGINPDSQDFVESLYALDLNGDGVISLPEFITWWKVGRQNTASLPKIYHLNEYVKYIMQNWFYFDKFVEQIDDIIKQNCNSKTNQSIYFKSPGEYQLKTFIEGSIAFGGPKRQQEAENFLKRFTTNVGSQKLNWISILFSLGKKKKISGDQAKQHLENFKDICLKWAESKGFGTFVSFLRNLLIFETSASETSVIMAIRLKADIEELVKTALAPISKIVDCLSTKTESAYMNIKAHSNEDIYNSIAEKRTLGDFFKVSECRIKSFGFRNRLRSFFTNISSEKIDLLGMLQFLFVPYSLDINMTGDLSDVTDPSQKKMLDFDLAPIGFFLDFLKQNISKELLSSADDIDIAFNAYDLFFHVKFTSEKMFSSK